MTMFDIVVIVGGIVLILIAVGCAIAASHGEERLVAMQETQNYTAQEIHQIYRHAGGGFGQACEITGSIETDNMSFSGPLSGQLCIAYSHTTTWEQWGPPPAYARRGSSEMVYQDGGTELDDRRVNSFWVRDATGRVLVEPMNADLDLMDIDQRYDVMSSSVGGGERRTTRSERALPLDQQVYVLGYLVERQGQPVLSYHPGQPSKKFLISYRDEQSLSRANRGRAYIYYFLAGSSGAIGLLLVLWRLMLHRGGV